MTTLRLSNSTALALCGALLSISCTDDGAGNGSDETGEGTDTGTDTSECSDPICTAWMLNETEEIAAEMINSDGSPLYVNVQSVSEMSVDGKDYIVVAATGIPNYTHTITQTDMDFLTGRPHAATDFLTGTPVVDVGDTLNWGGDVGYNYTIGPDGGCYEQLGGAGWWPPGPSCPTDQGFAWYFPRNPEPATETCYAIVGDAVAVLVNGIAAYNWHDGGSYNNQNVWHQLAQKFEIYDLDLCLGHATQFGTYHQHLDTPCLADQLGDDGSAASPIYGFAADGYPIYGKWHSGGEQVQSCWKTRDYEDPSSSTGCGGGGVRDCVLVDRLDPSQGTVPAMSAGPNTSDVVTSFSGNDFVVESGFYFEDYYFDSACAAQGGRFLDEHNGHDHDGLGYHYHVTEAFPYQPGPSFYGALGANAPSKCNSQPFGNMMMP